MKLAALARSALSAALLSALAVAATAATPPAPAYRVHTSGGIVHLEPKMHAPAWQLRVSGPDGKVAEDVLLDGEPLQIEAKLLGYARWLDGSYQFELVPVLGDRHRSGAISAQAPTKASVPGLRSSGSFRVQDGKVFVAGAAKEPAMPRAAAAPGGGTVGPYDQIIPDDLIVQSSICAGLDCVDAESFGYDTLRLKENNLRIHFDDTSTSVGYANNDWRIMANEQPSGGANKFMIEDSTASRVPFAIEAGAPANNLYLDSTGNIGFGTGTPLLDIHLSTTDTPAWRFEQTSAGGFTAQTWDIGANEANFFVRDLTGGSRLSLRIRPGAPTSSVDISADGDVGLGTGSPDAALDVERATGPVALRLGRTAGTTATLATWEMLNNQDSGQLTFSDDPALLRVPVKIGRDAVDNLFRVGVVAANTVDINGYLKIVNGNIQVTTPVGPDYVFAPGFALPSIGEHAARMFGDRHLPKVGPARVEDGMGVIDVGATSHAMLEELEYAHIYIAQLDGSVQALKAELAARDAEVRRMREEIDAIKAALAAD
jgi:hypothetical protein